MTYTQVCAKIVSLGGVETPSNLHDSQAYIMPSACLHLVALKDAAGGGVLAEAWALDDMSERFYVTTFYACGRDEVEAKLPSFTAQAQSITGESV
jgi:hypothetical protein